MKLEGSAWHGGVRYGIGTGLETERSFGMSGGAFTVLPWLDGRNELDRGGGVELRVAWLGGAEWEDVVELAVGGAAECLADVNRAAKERTRQSVLERERLTRVELPTIRLGGRGVVTEQPYPSERLVTLRSLGERCGGDPALEDLDDSFIARDARWGSSFARS